SAHTTRRAVGGQREKATRRVTFAHVAPVAPPRPSMATRAHGRAPGPKTPIAGTRRKSGNGSGDQRRDRADPVRSILTRIGAASRGSRRISWPSSNSVVWAGEIRRPGVVVVFGFRGWQNETRPTMDI